MTNEKRSTCGGRETRVRPLVMMTAVRAEVDVLPCSWHRGFPPQ